MSLNRRSYIAILLASVIVVNILVYCLSNLDSLIAALMIEAPAVELLGIFIAATLEIPIVRESTSAVKTANQIGNAVDKLADRGTEIDESVSGYHYIASELVDQTGIEYPTTIRSTPIATKYWIDNRVVKTFSMSSVERKTRQLEQRSREWFQSLGLAVIAIGFAIQLLASLLATL